MRLFWLCCGQFIACLWAALLVFGLSMAGNSDPANDKLLDHILAQVKPGQQTAFVGDMGFKVSTLEAMRGRKAVNTPGQARPLSSFDSTVQTWPGGIVPYAFDSTVTTADQTAFQTACAQWQAVANVHFIPWTNQANYVLVHSSAGNDSYVGMIGGAQDLDIYNWDYTFIICHELGHALGLIHEQNRDNRDSYVTILTADVQSNEQDQFAKLATSLDQGPYDFDSIMHYGAYDFSSNGLMTIQVNPPYVVQWSSAIGQRSHLSAGDKSGMARIYGAPGGTTALPQALTFSQTSLAAGASTTGTVTLSAAAPAGGLVVTLASGSTSAVSVPATVTVASGASSATFTAQALSGAPSGATTISASSGGTVVTASLTVQATSGSTTNVLWNNVNGSITLWSVNDSTGAFTHHEYGPYAGWIGMGIADGPDGKTRLLWNNVNGAAALWDLDATTGAFTPHFYGPYAGWTAKAVSVGPDNQTRLLWNNTDGRIAVWTVDDASGTFMPHFYGPYAGWTGAGLSVGPDNQTHLLWNNVNGSAALWNLDTTTGAFTPHFYGPYPGWSASGIADGPDGRTRLLWNNVNGSCALWSVDDASGAFSPYFFSPGAAWTAAGISVGSDNKTRVVWSRSDGSLSLWSVDSGTGAYVYHQYGPYPGWLAAAAASGP